MTTTKPHFFYGAMVSCAPVNGGLAMLACQGPDRADRSLSSHALFTSPFTLENQCI